MSYSVKAHFEILVGGQWHYYGEALFSNHVDFIDAYSDWVRKTGERYAPEDVTKTTELHTEKNGEPKSYATWLTSEEYQSLISTLTPEQTSGKGAFNHGNMRLFYASFDDWPQDKPEEVQDFRVIMWLEL